MAICTNCGQTLEEGAAFCTNCGTPVENTTIPSTPEKSAATTSVNNEIPANSDLPTTSYPTYDPNQTVAASTDAAETAVMPNASAANGNTVAMPASDTTYQAGASSQPVSYISPGSTAQMPAQQAPQMQQPQQIPQQAPQQMPQAQYAPAATQNAGSSNTTVIIVVAIVAVILVVVVAVLAITMNGSDDSSSGTATRNEQVSDTPASPESTKQQDPPSNANAQTSVTSDQGYILPDSNSRYLSESDLVGLSDYDLYLARNEIFARYGRGFKNNDLVQYFTSQPWYTQRYTPEQFDSMASPLNDYELKNIALIRSMEESRNSPYLS